MPSPSPSVEDIPVDIIITDKVFVGQCNDIVLNSSDYEGSSVKLEGLYDEVVDPVSGETVGFVYRNVKGFCCQIHGTVCGFEVLDISNRPKKGDWVEVIGTCHAKKTADNVVYVVLQSIRVRVMDYYGSESVA